MNSRVELRVLNLLYEFSDGLSLSKAAEKLGVEGLTFQKLAPFFNMLVKCGILVHEGNVFRLSSLSWTPANIKQYIYPLEQ